MTRNELEIMAPAGNFECLTAALQGGADSVYFGVGHLNMRSHSAANFTADDLTEVVRICHEAGVKAYLTLNITLYGQDLAPMRETLNKAKAAGVDAIIASDMACISYCRQIGLEVHISTQLSISNVEALKFYSAFADVVVLARELNLNQVKEISQSIETQDIRGPKGERVRIEMFAHGALCMAVSGKCYLSLQTYGASANRGACMQVCRRGYLLSDIENGEGINVDNKYLLSPKDLCTIEFMDKIVDAGVKVFKIEGRARSAEYVRRCTECYSTAASAVCEGTYSKELALELKAKLSEVFNRGFWDGYYQGARLGEWSSVYGSQATKRKVYLGKVTNWFSRLGVAEITVETLDLHKGDTLLAVGATTGAVEFQANDIRLELTPVDVVPKSNICSVKFEPLSSSQPLLGSGPKQTSGSASASAPLSSSEPAPTSVLQSSPKLHRGDKIFIWKEV